MPRESLKQFDKFLNCKLFLIDTIATNALLAIATSRDKDEALLEIRKICQANYETIINYMENKNNG